MAKTYLFIHPTALTILYTNNQSSASGAAKSNIWDSKRLLRNNPLSTLPARREKLWCGTLQHFQHFFKNKYKKKPQSDAGDIVHVSGTVCDKSLALWHYSMTSPSPPECTWMFVSLMSNFLHSSSWLSLLKPSSPAPKTGPIFSRVDCSLYRFFTVVNYVLWRTHESGMCWTVLQHQKGSQYRRNSLPEGQGSNYRGSCWI